MTNKIFFPERNVGFNKSFATRGVRTLRATRMLVCLILPIILLYSALALAVEKKVAVLTFENRASDKYRPFVMGISDILMNSLRESGRLEVVRKARVNEAMQNLAIKPGEPIDLQLAAKLGERLSADWVIQGSFLETYQIYAKCTDAKTGKLLLDQTVKGKKDEVIDLVDELGKRLLVGLSGGLTKKVALFPFANRASDEYLSFVRGISNMLVTGLEQSDKLTIIDRTQVKQAVQNFQLTPGEAIGSGKIVELGNWLGVDVIIQGSFLETYQIDAQLIDVKERKLFGEPSVKGGRSDITDMVGQLAKQLFKRKMTKKVAVLDFENRASNQYKSFVQGISDMLMTSLAQSEQVTVIERAQIDKAMQNFAFELSDVINAERTVKLGEWLGADAIVLGSFTKFGKTFRIDARLIDARTGELLAGQNVKGEEGTVISMIDPLGRSLLESFLGKAAELKGQTGTLEINFRIEAIPMTERSIFHHICKLYVDGKFMGESSVAKKKDGWKTIFSQELRAGAHKIEIVHGYMSKKEHKWAGKLDKQPKIFQVNIEPNSTTTIQYEYEVGWFKDQYKYKK